MKKRCKWTKKLNRYLDGELNPKQALATKNHLKKCNICKEKIQELKAVNSFLGKYESSSAPSYLQQKIIAKAQDIKTPHRGALAKLPIAVSALAAFVLGFIFSTQTFSNPEDTQIYLGSETLYSYLVGVEE
ncbi:MAG TPA: hypothetical protein DHM37_09195 [Candidatus Cloacimonas sp.]|jgi:anti-sigma factor RsiW|nr:hypothetical protein [Candidatus Cloacimonadota bacterium]HCX73879.1 hypothetical protein [Candidatus Cloacimonas sp.]